MNVPQDTGNTCDGQQYLATVAGGMQLNWAHLWKLQALLCAAVWWTQHVFHLLEITLKSFPVFHLVFKLFQTKKQIWSISHILATARGLFFYC
jgi:hypothetical protein